MAAALQTYGGASTSMVLAQTVVKRKVNLSGWADDVERAAQRAVYKLGQETRDMARSLAPIKTGGLRASIYVTRPASQPNQALGLFTKGQASAGYARAVKTATRLNPRQLWLSSPSSTGDEDMIDPRTQRSLAPEGHWDYMTKLTMVKVHKGANAHLGSQSYTAFDDDDRTIMPMAGMTRGTFYVTIGAGAYYAGFVEYGTTKQAAQPFMTPALAWARTQLSDRLTKAIGSERAAMVAGV